MTHDQKLASVRRWFTQNKGWIRLTAIAKKLEVPSSTLDRALTEDVNQQRNVSPEFLSQITDVFSAGSFNPNKDYAKAD